MTTKATPEPQLIEGTLSQTSVSAIEAAVEAAMVDVIKASVWQASQMTAAPAKSPPTTPAGRPSEFSGVFAGAIAFLVCRAAHVTDTQTLGEITLLVGGIPAAVTWLVVTFTGRN